jgi:NuA3 HAT complex component NTO1
VLEALDISPGFRAPRTRRGTAAAAAFEAEAHAEGEERAVQAADPSEQHSHKEAAKQRSRGWKRGPLVLPGHSEVPPIVEEVDKRQSFKMFDAGWILPENQKRGGRTAVERTALPPPRKRMRTSALISSNSVSTSDFRENCLDHEASRLSVLSTSASENQTLRLLVEDDEAGGGQADNNAMDVDIPPAEDGDMSSPLSEARSEMEATTSAKPMQKNDPPLRNIVYTPEGTIIVETLDTPALRRQKSLHRKAERLRLAAEAAAVASAGPSRLQAPGSASSSLTDLDGEEEEDEEKRIKPRVTAPAPPPPKDPAVVELAEGKMLEGGTLGTYIYQVTFRSARLIRA